MMLIAIWMDVGVGVSAAKVELFCALHFGMIQRLESQYQVVPVEPECLSRTPLAAS